VSVAATVAEGSPWKGVRVGVRSGVRVRVGVRVAGTGDDRARVAAAEGLGLNVGLAEDDGVTDGVSLAVAVWLTVALAVAVGCGVSEGRGRKGVAVDPLPVAAEVGRAGTVAALMATLPPTVMPPTKRGNPEGPFQSNPKKGLPASLYARATAAPTITSPASARPSAAARQLAAFARLWRLRLCPVWCSLPRFCIASIIGLSQQTAHSRGVPRAAAVQA
jgi:hypothetical protein